jgi:hypothetical protein
VSLPGAFCVEHECPQCGGAVALGEADRMLACPFCRARLALWPGEFFRYWIPPPPAAGDDVLLAPYWRIRGLDCALRVADANERGVRLFDVRERALDATFPAVGPSFLPQNLGLRPQAMKLRFATAQAPAFFLAPDRELAEAVAGTAKLSRLADEVIGGEAPSHREFIVETASLLYTPLVVRGDTVLDALLMRELPRSSGGAGALLERVERDRRWRLEFFAALCPECGCDLDGGPRSVVLLCRSCRTGWQGAAGGLRRVPCEALPAPGGAVMLPFWKLRAAISAFSLRTGDDLVRFANVSPGVRKGPGAAQLWFWVPAFPMSPSPFLRVARHLTVAQIPLDAQAPQGEQWGAVQAATIEAAKAFGAVKVLLAQLGQPRTEVFPMIPEVTATLEEAKLALLPFIPSGGDLIQRDVRLSITRSTLRV